MSPIIAHNDHYVLSGPNIIYKGIDPEAFVLEINTNLGTGASLTLPLISGYTYNFVVNWGDNSEGTVTAYNDADRIHNYSQHGTYRVTIKGAMPTIQFNNGGDRLKVTKVLSWGNVGFTVCSYAFYGCSNLSYLAIPTPKFTPANCTSMFRGCSSLTSIPYNLFSYSTLTGSASLFQSCTSLTSIPAGLLDRMSTTNIDSMFNGCTSLTSIPVDLFRYCTAIVFFTNVFANCTSLTSIPEDIFRYQTSVTSFSGVFGSCTGLTSIPENLFYYNNLVTNYSTALYYTRNLVLPSVIWNLANVSIVTNISNFMAASSTSYSHTGVLQDIWNYVTPATRTSAFLNQTSITNYADIPATWK